MFLNESSKITAHLTTSLWGPPAQQPLFPRARCRSPDRALLLGTFRVRDPPATLAPGPAATRSSGPKRSGGRCSAEPRRGSCAPSPVPMELPPAAAPPTPLSQPHSYSHTQKSGGTAGSHRASPPPCPQAHRAPSTATSSQSRLMPF